MKESAEEIKRFVRARYAGLAKAKSQSCCASRAEESTVCFDIDTSRQSQVHADRLYSSDELEKLPADVTDYFIGLWQSYGHCGAQRG